MRQSRWILAGGALLSVAALGSLAGANGDNDFTRNLKAALKGFGEPSPDVRAQAANEDFNRLRILNAAGAVVAAAAPDDFNDGVVGVYNRNGSPRVGMIVSGADNGQVGVFNAAGQVRFILDGSSGLQSVSGDLAETFPAREAASPGSVVVIDPQNPGSLRIASTPYDRRVAGVVAGAKDYRPGITLRALEPQQGRLTVTLTGTAYCLATNSNGAIKAGDLLTTSGVPGHAMKVTDYEAARGAILGKALEDLGGARGHVLILASLQ